MAFSPDGKYILTGSGDNTAKLWDRYGHEIKTFAGHQFVVASVAFAPDGQSVLTGSYDGAAKRWNLAGGAPLSFIGHKNYVNAVAFSPTGDTILTGSHDGTARLWSRSGNEIQRYAQSSRINAVAFSRDGKMVATGDHDGTVTCWNLSGKVLHKFNNSTAVKSLAIAPDGKSVLAGYLEGPAKRWSLLDQAATLIRHEGAIHAVAFARDGSFLTGNFNDGSVRVWSPTGQERVTYGGHAWGINAAAFSPDGQYVLTGSADRSARLWDLSGHTIQVFDRHTSNITAMACAADGKKLVIGNSEGVVKIVDLAGFELGSFSAHGNSIGSVAFSPGGQAILTGSHDGKAKLWTPDGREKAVFAGHKGLVNSVAFSPGGDSILTGSFDKTAILWSLDGNKLKTFEHPDDVGAVAFSPKGQVVTACADGLVRLWNRPGKVDQTVEVRTQIKSLALSPNGELALTGGFNGHTQLWDINGGLRQQLGMADREVHAVAFSPDGAFMLAGNADKSARLWNTVDDGLLFRFTGHTDEVTAVAFLPGGKFALTGSKDGTVKFWDIRTGAEKATLIPLDSADWAVTSPGGLFDASPEAMKVMYYTEGLEVIALNQLKTRYYEPGLLRQLLGFTPGFVRSVAGFDTVALYPEVSARVETSKNQLIIDLTPRNGGLGKLSLFVSGKEVSNDINPDRLSHLVVDLTAPAYAKYYSPELVDTLALLAFNADGWLQSQPLALPYQAGFIASKGQGADDAPQPTSLRAKPHLYILAVGTSKYGGTLSLRYPDQDAANMAQALSSVGRVLFEDRVHVRLLSTSGTTADDISSKTNIQRAFQEFGKQAKPADILVVFFSGHGVSYGEAEKGQFYYLTKDISSEDISDPGVRANYTLSSDELTGWLTDNPARKQVLILDACNSGKIVEALEAIGQKDLSASRIRALDRMKDRSGIFILTGSAADKVSYEASQYGQGLLTYALLQGMSGLGLKDNDVDVTELFNYACDQVPEMAKGIGGVQKPMVVSPQSGSFAIGIVDETVKIPLIQPKPVFIRNVFMDAEQLADALGLADALEDYFSAITLKGAGAELIYVDVKKYDNAYSVKGIYTVKGKTVKLRARLRKGETPVGDEFELEGNTDALPDFVQKIVDTINPLVKK